MPKSVRPRDLVALPKSVSAHRVLVHNHIQHTTDMPVGLNGFRAWTQLPDYAKLDACNCGWSGFPHYKVRGIWSGTSVSGTYLEFLAKQEAEDVAGEFTGPWKASPRAPTLGTDGFKNA